ncbi:MAG TPA: hypothetical protein VFO10_09005 [Oligoflexus sp.]|uniref:hypothetical protein n=1 Tax=Oligoflexus sp. TaxID=1971216 RepID=UPI002D7E3387|nr:hypothetical protein [Oligoflexus sp.]HET9237376.1 hypothetical protein [Oligoflexus sp.]
MLKLCVFSCAMMAAGLSSLAFRASAQPVPLDDLKVVHETADAKKDAQKPDTQNPDAQKPDDPKPDEPDRYYGGYYGGYGYGSYHGAYYGWYG